MTGLLEDRRDVAHAVIELARAIPFDPADIRIHKYDLHFPSQAMLRLVLKKHSLTAENAEKTQ